MQSHKMKMKMKVKGKMQVGTSHLWLAMNETKPVRRHEKTAGKRGCQRHQHRHSDNTQVRPRGSSARHTTQRGFSKHWTASIVCC